MQEYEGNIFQLMDDFSVESNTQYMLRYENKDNILFKNIHVGKLFQRIKITLSIKNLTGDIIPKTENEENPTTLVEAIGSGDEYKLLFDVLKYNTKLSKKEISDILRKETVCEEKNKNYIFIIEFSPYKLYN